MALHEAWLDVSALEVETADQHLRYSLSRSTRAFLF